MDLASPLAYIDPMSGAIILQVLFAGAIGCAAFFRRAIKAFFVKVLRRRSSSDAEASEEKPSTSPESGGPEDR